VYQLTNTLRHILLWVFWLWLVSYNIFLSKVLWETWDRLDALEHREPRPSIYIEEGTIYGGKSEMYITTKENTNAVQKD